MHCWNAPERAVDSVESGRLRGHRSGHTLPALEISTHPIVSVRRGRACPSHSNCRQRPLQARTIAAARAGTRSRPAGGERSIAAGDQLPHWHRPAIQLARSAVRIDRVYLEWDVTSGIFTNLRIQLNERSKRA